MKNYEHLFERVFAGFIREGHFEPLDKAAVFSYVEKKLEKKLTPLLQTSKKQVSEKSIVATQIYDLCDCFLDIKLISTQSHQLVTKHMPLIARRVRHFSTINAIAYQDKEDYEQTVCENLLLKIEKGQLTNYEPRKGDVRSYIKVIIDNIIKTELNAKHRKPIQKSMKEAQHRTNTTLDWEDLKVNTAFQEHLELLKASFKGFPQKERNKLELSTKVVYRLLLKNTDIRPPFLHCMDDLLIEILSIFGIPYATLSKGVLFDKLSWTINELHESEKRITSEALRKWFNRRLQVLWSGVFGRQMNAKEKNVLDSYFELLVYALYDN